MKKLTLIVLITLFSSIGAQAQTRNDTCNESLKQRIYAPWRFNPNGTNPDGSAKDRTLPMVSRCVAVTGTITDKKDAGAYDLDLHVTIDPDTPDPNYLLRGQGRRLIIEIVCATPPTSATRTDAKNACAGYTLPPRLSWPHVNNFRIGQRVRIVGFEVIDYGHRTNTPNGVREIHGVTSIEKYP